MIGGGKNTQISEKRGGNKGFLLFSTKTRGRNKVGEEIKNLAKIFTPANVWYEFLDHNEVFPLFH